MTFNVDSFQSLVLGEYKHFPRTEWELGGPPPSSEWDYPGMHVAWAARAASRLFKQALDGDAAWDEVTFCCFKLAVFDKVHEINLKVRSLYPREDYTRETIAEWMEMVDWIIPKVYSIAHDQMSRAAPNITIISAEETQVFCRKAMWGFHCEFVDSYESSHAYPPEMKLGPDDLGEFHVDFLPEADEGRLNMNFCSMDPDDIDAPMVQGFVRDGLGYIKLPDGTAVRSPERDVKLPPKRTMPRPAKGPIPKALRGSTEANKEPSCKVAKEKEQ